MKADWKPISSAPKDGRKLMLVLPKVTFPGPKGEAVTMQRRTVIGYWHKLVLPEFKKVKGGLFKEVEKVRFEGWTTGLSSMGLYYHKENPTHWDELPEVP